VIASTPRLAFFDPAHGAHGILRAGVTLLFEGGASEAVSAGAAVSPEGDGYRAALADRLELSFSPVSDPVAIGGVSARVCRVTGSVAGWRVDCLGTASVDLEAPRWADLDALRSVSALWDTRTAVLLDARRPRFALGHGQELVEAHLLRDGTVTPVGEARLSTVYDALGRQRTAGLELWTGQEDLPRRAAGTAVAGTSIELEGLRVEVAVFAWSMEGREGFGAYEITVRDALPAAA
jgi:hypothetical protein